MPKLTLSDVTNILGNPTSAQNRINSNNDLIESAIENTLSRDGSSPNQMNSDIDLNENDLLNVNVISAKTLYIDDLPVQPGSLVNALLIGNNLSDLEDVQEARSNLGLGNSSTRDVGTTVGTVAAGNDSRIVKADTLLTGMTVENPYGVESRRYTDVGIQSYISSIPDDNDWIPSGPAAIHGRATDNLHAVLGEVTQANSPGNWSFPCGVVGTGILNSAGNSVFGIFGRVDLKSNGVGTNELNTFNYVAGPPGVYPPNRGFGLTNPMPITLTLAAGGDFPSFCALDIAKEGSEPQTYYTGIYTNANAVTDFGMLVDSSSTEGPKTSAFLKNKLSDTDSVALMLQNTNNSYNSSAKLIKALAPGGSTVMSLSPTGKLAVGVDSQAIPTQLNVTGNDTVRGLANTVAMLGVDLSAGSTIGAAVQLGSLNGNTPYIAASRYGASATTPAPLLLITDSIERVRVLPSPGNGLGVKTPVPVNSYANDAAAASAGIQIGEWYRNGSQIMIRVT